MIKFEEFSKSYFNYWKNCYDSLKKSNELPSYEFEKDNYIRNSLPESLSDGMSYMVTQGLMQYENVNPRPQIPTELSPLYPGGRVKLASVTYLPSPFPATQFEYAKALAIPFNSLCNNLTCSPKWLVKELSPMAELDDYVANMVKICKRVYIDGGKRIENDIRFLLLRSDYMTDFVKNKKKENFTYFPDIIKTIYPNSNSTNMNTDNMQTPSSGSSTKSIDIDGSFHLKQIELNTVSVSLVSFVNNLVPIHKVQLQKILNRQESQNLYNQEKNFIQEFSPFNNPLMGFARAFFETHNTYKQRYCPKNPLSILFIVDKSELNEIDQRHLAFAIESNYGINIIRASLVELNEMKSSGSFYHIYNSLSKSSSQEIYKPYRLLIKEKVGVWENAETVTYEISLIYFRSCYAPHHFSSLQDWDILEWMEGSEAVKCPTVPMLLSGMKKIQESWCKEGILEQFSDACEKIRPCFANQIDLNDDSSKAQAIFLDAIENPQNYVLKPQREGGGNNIHGDQLKETIKAFIKEKEIYKQLNEFNVNDVQYLASDVNKTYNSKLVNKSSNNSNVTNLASTNTQPVSAYILMEKIKPLQFPTIHYRTNYPSIDQPRPSTIMHCIPSISELGIYSVAVFDGKNEKLNDYAGYLLRTKNANDDEGGFVTGVSSIDSLLLFNDRSSPVLSNLISKL